MTGLLRSLSTPKLLTAVFLLAVLLIYSHFFISYLFFGGGMWDTVAYALRGAIVIGYFSLTAVAIFTSFASVGRLGKDGALRFVAPLIAVFLLLNALLLIIGNIHSGGTIPLFLMVFGLLGFLAGRAQMLAATVHRRLIDAGSLVVALLVVSKTLEYVISGYSAMDWRLLLCTACYALPVTIVARVTTTSTRSSRVAVGVTLLVLVCVLLSEPYVPLRAFGVVILPYIKRHALWSYWTWSLAGISAGIAVLNAMRGYGSSWSWKSPRMKHPALETFALVGAYNLVILLDWKYQNEPGVQELVIIASTLWVTACLFGPRQRDESGVHTSLP